MEDEPILYFIGAGAAKNSWEPVLDALRAHGYPDLRTSCAANNVLAGFVYSLRLACRTAKSEADPARRAEFEKLVVRGKKELAEVKAAIASKLAASAIRLQPTLAHLILKETFQQPQRIRVVTTNWERSVDLFKVADQIYYVHGSVDSPTQIYLPTEVFDEEYREPSDREHLRTVHHEIVAFVARWACVIKVYGLSFSALDAELSAIFHAGLAHPGCRVKRVHIYDFDYVTVAERLAQWGRAGSAELPIICHLPTEPDRVAWTFNPDEVASEGLKVARARARKLLDE